MKPVKQTSAAINISLLYIVLLALHVFIADRIIPAFQHQRQRGYQFAVLLLIPESDVHNINNLSHWLWPMDNIHGLPLVNSANRYCPNRQLYRNYVSARPQGALHSEDTLLDELPYLRDAFENHYGSVPSCIILYSWMMPCPYCTMRICQTFQDINIPVIVAYTIDWPKISADDNERSRNQLRAAGIRVERINYGRRLLPAQDYNDTDTEEKSSANSLARRLKEIHLQDASEEYDTTNSEEYDVTDTAECDVADTEEYYAEEYYDDSDEEDEDEIGEELSSQLQEVFLCDGNGLPPVGQDGLFPVGQDGLFPVGQDGLFPEVPVRRKPLQAQLESRQEDDHSLTDSQLETFLRLLSTNADDQCTDSEDDGFDFDDDGFDFVLEDEPPDRYKLT